ncbi:MAG: RICIN domain-containing protein, partial [Acidobacteriaceae bacterium]|nr:RICIN domain-containing protein [Acidobacteriaceae bacterium]
AAVVQWPFWGGPNQTWRAGPTPDGYFTLSPLHSGKCLDVSGISVEDGAAVYQWTCWGGDNQKWSFVQAQ